MSIRGSGIRGQRSPKKNLRAKLRNVDRKAVNKAMAPIPWHVRGITPAKRLAEIDAALGAGVGAKKERAKLARIR